MANIIDPHLYTCSAIYEMRVIRYKGARKVPFCSRCSASDESLGDGHVNREVSGPAHPFLVIQAAYGASESIAVQEGHGYFHVVHMSRHDTAAKWCRMVLHLVRAMHLA